MTERQRALQLLRRIEREGAFASLLLQNETGFVRTLVLGVLRWRSRLDFAVDALAKRAIEPEVRDLLRLGAYQLMYMDVAKYAAVGETVALAPHRARGFANAILRRIADGKAPEPRDLATRTAHPPWLIERWTRMYGEERTARIAAANQELSYPDVIIDGELPPDAEPSRLVDGIAKLKGSSAGFYGIDEGSAVIAAIAAATADEVLDLAAAPGGKTRVMRKRGARVVSNDVSIARLRPLIGASNRIVVSDGRKPPFRRQFRTVLLDAPCSATGTIRKSPELKWRLQEQDVASFATLQRELLASAMKLASETVVYSTCSLEPEENDEVVRGYERLDVSAYAPEGVKPWIEDGVLRLTPESGADGFTAFALRTRMNR
ncbi:MAG TPA: transcription antitermination factor NusB [Thermoanaerobaculia bacterium]|nr:transcription antitermination factor NusB [Thermoanaerobaculia bacterium]